MSKLTEFRVLAGAAPVLAAVVIAGTATPETFTSISFAAGQEMPTVPYWHVWTDEKGVSHQDRCEWSAFQFRSISEGAAPSWIDKQSTPAATVLIVVQPVGWVGEWHENPKPQWIIPLSGRWFVETMDGKRVEMGPGEVSFGGDQNTKPDAQGRKGHRSGTVGNQPSVNMIVQLEEDPCVGQPCGFK
jgi:hypothetical protein